MRVALCVTLCVVLLATAYAKDLALGQCGDDDVVLVDRNIRRPAIPGVPMYTKLIARAPLRSSITCVTVKTADGTDPDVNVIKGGVGHRFVFILVRGHRGDGLNLQFTARARSRLTTTTDAPTTASSIPTIPTGIPTSQKPEPSTGTPGPTPTTEKAPDASSPPASPIPTVKPPTTSTEAPPSTASPAPTGPPAEVPTAIPTLAPKDGDDNDEDGADLAELLSLDGFGED